MNNTYKNIVRTIQVMCKHKYHIQRSIYCQYTEGIGTVPVGLHWLCYLGESHFHISSTSILFTTVEEAMADTDLPTLASERCHGGSRNTLLPRRRSIFQVDNKGQWSITTGTVIWSRQACIRYCAAQWPPYQIYTVIEIYPVISRYIQSVVNINTIISTRGLFSRLTFRRHRKCQMSDKLWKFKSKLIRQ